MRETLREMGEMREALREMREKRDMRYENERLE